MSSDLEKQLRATAIEAAIAYYQHAHAAEKTFSHGDRIPYAGRVFDEREISLLIDAFLASSIALSLTPVHRPICWLLWR